MLKDIQGRRVRPEENGRYQELMQTHHYRGALPKIGEPLWYVATWCQEWVALLSFSAAALKIAARERWIGWSSRQQYARLHLLRRRTHPVKARPARRANPPPPQSQRAHRLRLPAHERECPPNPLSASRCTPRPSRAGLTTRLFTKGGASEQIYRGAAPA